MKRKYSIKNLLSTMVIRLKNFINMIFKSIVEDRNRDNFKGYKYKDIYPDSNIYDKCMIQVLMQMHRDRNIF